MGDAEMAESTAQFAFGFVAVARDVQADVQITLGIACRAKGEFVVVAADTEIVAHGLVHIGGSVAVGVDEACQFGTLHHQHFTVADGDHAEWFVQAEGKGMPVLVRRIIGHHFAAMKGRHEFPRRRHR